MNELKTSINAVIESIGQVTALFYQQKIGEGYNYLVDTISLLMGAVENINQHQALGNEIDVDMNELTEVIAEAMNSLEQKDAIMLSDILQYELKERFIRIRDSI